MGVKDERVVLVAVIELVPRKEASEQSEASDGKATSGVATEAYRQGWDSIFGKKQEVGQA